MNNSSADVAQREAKVTVIVPTMARPERRLQLQRAIYSIRASSAEPIWIIVVVNGTQFDVSVCAWLREQADVQLEMLSTPSAPGAVLRGRELVRTEFFSTLDDDDEYLPRSTDLKICALLNNKDADLLVANLYTHTEGVDELTYDRLLEVPANPLGCLMKFAWLHKDRKSVV